MNKLYLSLITLTLITGCASKHNQPLSTAQDFWEAEQKYQTAQAAKLTLKGDEDNTKLHQKIKIDKIEFSDPKISEDASSASVPTILTLKDFSMINHAKAKISFDTKMQKDEEKWKVNMFETKKALYLAIGKEFAQSLSRDLTTTIQQTLGDQKQIEGIFKQLIKGLQKATQTED